MSISAQLSPALTDSALEALPVFSLEQIQAFKLSTGAQGIPSLIASEMLEDGDCTWTLPTLVGVFMSVIEELYGPRDTSWMFLGVDFADVPQPSSWFPGFGKQVAIRLTNDTAFDPRTICYQLAHECVHLLAPTHSDVTVLEEGLATVFSLDAMRHMFQVLGRKYSPGPVYAPAAELTRDLLRRCPDAIRRLRQIEPCFSDMTPETFYHAGLADLVPSQLIQALLARFADSVMSSAAAA